MLLRMMIAEKSSVKQLFVQYSTSFLGFCAPQHILVDKAFYRSIL
jgi:hypothetical protein